MSSYLLISESLEVCIKSYTLGLTPDLCGQSLDMYQASTWITLSFNVSSFPSLETGPHFLRVDLTLSSCPLTYCLCTAPKLPWLSTLTRLLCPKPGQAQLFSWLQLAAPDNQFPGRHNRTEYSGALCNPWTHREVMTAREMNWNQEQKRRQRQGRP